MGGEITAEVVQKAAKAVERAQALGAVKEGCMFDLFMDLTLTHSLGPAIDFDRLLAFTDEDFLHDVFGIKHHLDLSIGGLKDGYVPKCAEVK